MWRCRDQGWIAVQAPDGTEAYTRAGDLHVDADGQLRTATGYAVLGDNGPLSVSPYAAIVVGQDGSVSIVPPGQTPQTMATIGRIKLVNPPSDTLERTTGGLFRLKGGGERMRMRACTWSPALWNPATSTWPRR